MDAVFVRSASSGGGYPKLGMPEIAFAGRSNVGKSSLINCLVGRKKLATTSSTPGKTRLLNFFSIDRRLCFVDLPGYGYARVPERIHKDWGRMVEEYLTGSSNLRSVVLVVDVRREIDEREQELIEFLRRLSIPQIAVATKSDKLGRTELARRERDLRSNLQTIGIHGLILFSSVTGMGKKHLWTEILKAAVQREQSNEGSHDG